MKTLKLPYRGNVRDLAASGDALYLAVSHEDMPSCGTYRLNMAVALDPSTAQPETASAVIALGEASSEAVCTSAAAAYVLGDDSVLYRVAHDATVASALGNPFAEGGARFVAFGEGLWAASEEAVVALNVDVGAAPVSASSGGGGGGFAGKKVLFTGTLESMKRKDAQASVQAAGGETPSSVVQDLDYLVLGNKDMEKFEGGWRSSKLKKAEALIEGGSALQIISEARYAEILAGGGAAAAEDAGAPVDAGDGSELHRFGDFGAPITAFSVTPDGAYVAVGHADGGLTLFTRTEAGYDRESLEAHDAQIDVVSLVANENTVEAVAFASDLTMSHTRLDDFKTTMRTVQKGNHTKAVVGLVRGPAGRFYTLGLDGEIKQWTDTFSKRPPATTRVVAGAACVMTLPWTNSKGKIVDRPHLVVAGKSTPKVSAYDITVVRKDSKNASDAGKLGERQLQIDGAMAWADHHGQSKDIEVRKRVVSQLGAWLDVPSLDKLMVFSRDDGDKSVREAAFAALTSSTHPRLGPLLEQLIRSSFVDSAQHAFEHMRVVHGEAALRPMAIALRDGRTELGVAAAKALGERFGAGDQVARADLIDVLGHKQSRVARAAATELEKAIESADGVLMGLRSTHIEIQLASIERLYVLNLLGEARVQSELRRLREDENERLRTHAFLVTLLSDEQLATFVRAGDEEVHKQLVVIEASAEGLDAEERQARLDNPPAEDAVSPDALSESARAMIMELSTCQQSDISLLGVVAQARTGDPRALPVLLLISQDKGAVVRLRATIGLSALARMPAAEQRLRALIDDGDVRVRAKALHALAQSAPELLDVVEAGLNSRQEDTRMSALGFLQLKIREGITERSRNLLDRALFDKSDLRLAREASKTLRQVLESDRASQLRVLLRNPHDEIVEEAISQLSREVREGAETAHGAKERFELEGELGELTSTALEVSKSSLRQFAFERLHKILKRTSAVDALLKVAIHCKHDDIRKKTLEVLDPRDTHNQFILKDALSDESRQIRHTAWEVIVKTFKEEKYAEILKALMAEGLGTQHDDIREAAISVVLGLSLKGRRDLLWQALFDTLPGIRTRAMQALLEAGDMQAALAALQSPYRDLRVQAARGLAERGDPRAMPSMLQTLRQPKPKDPPEDATPEQVYEHREALAAWYTEVEDALDIIHEIGDESAYPDVARLLELEDERLEQRVVKVLGSVTPDDKLATLAELLRHPKHGIVEEAARSLARSGDLRGVRDLWQRNASESDRQESALVLGREGALDYVLKLIHGKESVSVETLFVVALQSVVTGGTTLAFSAGLTASNSETRLLSAMLLERSYAAEPLFERLCELLGRYSRLSKKALERFHKEHGEDAVAPEVSAQDWRRVSRLLAHAQPRVRARVVPKVLARLRREVSIKDFVVALDAMNARFGSEVMEHRPTDIEAERAKGWAVGAYAGIVRTPGAVRDRLKALRRLLDLDEDASIGIAELRAVLEVAVVSNHADLRKRALRELHARRERFGLSTRDVAELGIASQFVDNAFESLLLLAGSDGGDVVHQMMRERDDLVAYMAANVLLANALRNEPGRMLPLLQDALRARRSDLRIITTNRLCYMLEQYRFDKDVKAAQEASAEDDLEKQQEALFETLEKRSSLRDGAQNEAFIASLMNLARRTEGAGLTEEALLEVLLGALATDETGSPYPDVRNHIAMSLAKIAEPGVMGVLNELLQSNVEAEQRRAIEAFSTFDAAEAAEALLGRMRNDPSNTALKSEIFNALSALRRPEVVGGLLELLPRNRNAVVGTVLRISGHDIPIPPSAEWEKMNEKERKAEEDRKYDDGILARLMEAVIRAGAYDTLDLLMPPAKTARSSDQGIDEALAKLAQLPRRSDTDTWRHEAISAIAWRLRERDGTADALVKALANKDPETRFRAAEGLALGERDEGLDELLRVAKSSETEGGLRKRAITALGELGDIRAVQFLLDIVVAPDKYADLFSDALKAIGHMSHSAFADQIFSALKQASEAPAWSTVNAALGGLHRFNTSESWALIRSLATHRQASVRGEACKLLLDDLDSDAALAVALERIEKDDSVSVMKAALESAKALVEAEDTRPWVAVFKAESRSNDTSKEALDALIEHGGASLWLELMVYGRLEDAKTSRSTYASDCQRLEGAIRSAEVVPVSASVASLQTVVESVLSDKSSGNADATRSLFDALVDFVGSASSALESEDGTSLVALVGRVRERWVELDARVARGRREDIGPRSETEHVWRRMLELLGTSGLGSSEIAEALSTPRLTGSLTQSALLALEQLPGASRAVCQDLVVRAADHDVRVLAATLLGPGASPEEAAAAMGDAMGDLSVLQRLTGKDATRLDALRKQLSGGARLAAYELARLGDVEGVATVVQDPELDESLRVEAVRALGSCSGAVETLGDLGRNAGLSQPLRDAAWRARRRALRARKRQEQEVSG